MNWHRGSLLVGILVLACHAGLPAAGGAAEATKAADNGSGPNGMRGYRPPPAIPGYEPSNDPRDFTGVWVSRPLPGQTRFQISADVKLNEAGQAAADRRAATLKAINATSAATPHVMCRPTGINAALTPIAPIYVLQNEREMAFIITDEIRNVRHVYIGDSHPKNLKPSYMGHSIAHWEGNTLVVDTIGYNGRGEMDKAGTTHSDRMHLIERISKSADGKTLDIDAWFEDPGVLASPVTVKRQWGWLHGQQPLEFDCEENPREDNFADMLFEREYMKPICIQHEGKGDEPSKVICEKP